MANCSTCRVDIVRIRAGIHYGSVIIGKFDAGHMKKIAALGDPVNVASRIESANKKFGTRILLSEQAFRQLRGAIRSVKRYAHTPKGKKTKQILYEIQHIK